MADKVTQKGKSMTISGGVKTAGQMSTIKGPVFREIDATPKKRDSSNPNPGKRMVV